MNLLRVFPRQDTSILSLKNSAKPRAAWRDLELGLASYSNPLIATNYLSNLRDTTLGYSPPIDKASLFSDGIGVEGTSPAMTGREDEKGECHGCVSVFP
jgi:hypothetical protein